MDDNPHHPRIPHPPPTRAATAMAPSTSSLSPAAPAYVPTRCAPLIPPPPRNTELVTYICMPPVVEFLPYPLLPSAPELLPCRPLAPPPPPPCWSVPGMHAAAYHGCVVPHVAMGMAMPPPTGPVPVPAPAAWPPRRPLHAPRMQRAAGPAPAAPCGVKAAVDAEAATNQPSPRSVLVVTSPPISPTTSLPASFPYPAPRARAKSRRRLRGLPSRATHASTVFVRRTVKPRCIFDGSSKRTSLMIRNIPNDFTRKRLMNILDQHCSIENEKIAPGGVRSEYDFLYVSIDFRKHANKGYAFVNMTSPVAARRLWEDLNGHRWVFKSSAKTCAVDYAVLQGLDKLVEHFSESRFDCHTEEFLPVRFVPPRDGTRPAEGALHVVGKLGRPCARK